MTNTATPVTQVTHLIWNDATAWLAGHSAMGEDRQNVVVANTFTVTTGKKRYCTGVWHQGKRLACATRATINPAATSGQCPECAAMARSRSIATDTHLDDPRSFTVYLAHHGSVIKVGITASMRGRVRLLEQGALAALLLSTGSLLSARRTESVLGTALGLPERVTIQRKREARSTPGTAAERREKLLEVLRQALAVGLPEGQEPLEGEPHDFASIYNLPAQGIRPTHAMAPLAVHSTLTGTVQCVIGRDLYLDTGQETVLVDTGLLQGWETAGDGEPEPATIAPLVRLDTAPVTTQDALF